MDLSRMVRKWPAKPKADRAARVRDNQRRHRAKTKAYIAELEDQVASMGSQLGQVLEQNKSLVLELELLRCRLEDSPQSGERNDLDATAPLSPVHAVRQRHRVVPHTQAPTSSTMERPRTPSPVRRDITHVTPESGSTVAATSWRPCLSSSITQRPSISRTSEGSPTTPPSARDDDEPCTYNRTADDAFVSPPTTAPLSNVEISALRTSCSHLAPPCPGESTIPCGTAYGIINHQNYSGHDIATITRLLQPGFRGATPDGDDCRVMSSLVFTVLDVISST